MNKYKQIPTHLINKSKTQLGLREHIQKQIDELGKPLKQGDLRGTRLLTIEEICTPLKN